MLRSPGQRVIVEPDIKCLRNNESSFNLVHATAGLLVPAAAGLRVPAEAGLYVPATAGPYVPAAAGGPRWDVR